MAVITQEGVANLWEALTKAEAENAKLREALAKVQWCIGTDGGGWDAGACPECHNVKAAGHESWCDVGNALEVK